VKGRIAEIMLARHSRGLMGFDAGRGLLRQLIERDGFHKVDRRGGPWESPQLAAELVANSWLGIL